MSEQSETVTPHLWTQAGFRDDAWRRVESAEEAVAGERLILPLEVWLSLGPNARAGFGVHIAPGEGIEPLLPHLAGLPLISLGFPKFSDGRSFSKAELLRSRHGYKGRIRASGEVLIDQIPHMLRTGFDEFEVSDETALRRLEEGRLGGLPRYYQPTAKAAAAGERYSWRRIPA